MSSMWKKECGSILKHGLFTRNLICCLNRLKKLNMGIFIKSQLGLFGWLFLSNRDVESRSRLTLLFCMTGFLHLPILVSLRKNICPVAPIPASVIIRAQGFEWSVLCVEKRKNESESHFCFLTACIYVEFSGFG